MHRNVFFHGIINNQGSGSMNNFDLEINEENIKDTDYKNILGRNKKLVMLSRILVN